MDKRTIYSYVIKVKYKKGKSFVNKEMTIVSVAKTAMEMNNISRVIRTLQAEVFGHKSAAYKSGAKNLWVTKILSSVEVGKSFHYTDENYKL